MNKHYNQIILCFSTKRKWKPPKKNKEKDSRHKLKKAKFDTEHRDNNSNIDLMNTEDLAMQLLRR